MPLFYLEKSPDKVISTTFFIDGYDAPYFSALVARELDPTSKKLELP